MATAFGVAVRKLRKEKGFSQEAFAFHCDIHRTYMSLIERGKNQATLYMANRMASGLGLRLSELISYMEKELANPGQP